MQAFRYGVRYFEEGSEAAMIEAGFDDDNTLNTGNILEDLEAGETRRQWFAGPRLSAETGSGKITPVVEILGVRASGSFTYR